MNGKFDRKLFYRKLFEERFKSWLFSTLTFTVLMAIFGVGAKYIVQGLCALFGSGKAVESGNIMLAVMLLLWQGVVVSMLCGFIGENLSEKIKDKLLGWAKIAGFVLASLVVGVGLDAIIVKMSQWVGIHSDAGVVLCIWGNLAYFNRVVLPTAQWLVNRNDFERRIQAHIDAGLKLAERQGTWAKFQEEIDGKMELTTIDSDWHRDDYRSPGWKRTPIYANED